MFGIPNDGNTSSTNVGPNTKCVCEPGRIQLGDLCLACDGVGQYEERDMCLCKDNFQQLLDGSCACMPGFELDLELNCVQLQKYAASPVELTVVLVLIAAALAMAAAFFVAKRNKISSADD